MNNNSATDSSSTSSKAENAPRPSSSRSNVSGSGQQFFLRWNNYQNNLCSVFDRLLQNEDFVDVTLTTEGKALKCHKVVLSACSPYFSTLLSENPSQHPIVILRDIPWKDLRAIVEYMYRGEIQVEESELSSILKAADALKIRGLVDFGSGVGGAELVREEDLLLQRQVSSAVEDENLSMSPPAAVIMNKKRRLSSAAAAASPPASSSTAPTNRLVPRPTASLMATPPPKPVSPPKAPSSTPPIAPPQMMNSPTAYMSNKPSNRAKYATTSASSTSSNVLDDLSDVKPGIMELIQEERRAKLLEASQITQNWMQSQAPSNGPNGAAAAAAAAGSNPRNNSPVPGSSNCYQYQLQSMWQKCWNQNAAAFQSVRYRERGPMKSWRPETMAEAIWSVLQEGLSLSQAARKHDIPYPTFVLYANRVHNMLGPSVHDGSGPTIGELRPKGRGRPQRILLGNWPEDHVKQVIRAVVFRDGTVPQHTPLPPAPPPQHPPPGSHLGSLQQQQQQHFNNNDSPPPLRRSPPNNDNAENVVSSSKSLADQFKEFYDQQMRQIAAAAAAGKSPLEQLAMKNILADNLNHGNFEDAEMDEDDDDRLHIDESKSAEKQNKFRSDSNNHQVAKRAGTQLDQSIFKLRERSLQKQQLQTGEDNVNNGGGGGDKMNGDGGIPGLVLNPEVILTEVSDDHQGSGQQREKETGNGVIAVADE